MIWNFDTLKDHLEGELSEKRFRHTLGVVETAEHLAIQHGADVNDAKFAALLHDVAKEQNIQVAEKTLISKNEVGYLEHSKKVWHAPVGAYVAKEKFGIEDGDVLNAIRYHTTGRPAMTLLEKVIFVADYTEPNRTYKGCLQVRDLWDDLDQAVYEILRQKVEKVKASSKDMHPDTLAAYDYYVTVVTKKDLHK